MCRKYLKHDFNDVTDYKFYVRIQIRGTRKDGSIYVYRFVVTLIYRVNWGIIIPKMDCHTWIIDVY